MNYLRNLLSSVKKNFPILFFKQTTDIYTKQFCDELINTAIMLISLSIMQTVTSGLKLMVGEHIVYAVHMAWHGKSKYLSAEYVWSYYRAFMNIARSRQMPGKQKCNS